MNAQDVILGLVGLVCTGLGWWLKDLWQAHQVLRGDLSRFQEKVPETYVTKVDYKSDILEIKDTLREIARDLRAQRGPE